MVKKWNAKDCVVTVGNVYITGLAEDFVSWEKDEDNFEAVVGAQGDVCVNEINNDLYTLSLTVQATSPQIPYLRDLDNQGAEVPVWVVNKTLGEKFGGNSARILKSPSIEYGQSASDRECQIKVFDGAETNI